MSAAPPPAAGAPVPVPAVYQEGANPEIAKLQEHQKTAARPTAAEDARTLIALAKHAVLSTLSASGDAAGFPFGSVVEFADDGAGAPLLATSTLSPHTADLLADGRCSLTVMAPGFKARERVRTPPARPRAQPARGRGAALRCAPPRQPLKQARAPSTTHPTHTHAPPEGRAGPGGRALHADGARGGAARGGAAGRAGGLP